MLTRLSPLGGDIVVISAGLRRACWNGVNRHNKKVHKKHEPVLWPGEREQHL